MSPSKPLVLVVIAAFGLLAAACGSSEAGTHSGVASLEDVAGAGDGTPETGADEELSAEDAALAFSQCMRDAGLDFPDIGVDAEGNPDIRDAFEGAGVDPRSDEFRGAMEGCRDLLQGIGFGGGGRAALADNSEFQDAALAFSDCIRDQGFDVGDLTFGQGAPGQSGDGPDGDGAGSRGQGQGQGGFGSRDARFAQLLGLDAEDPAVAVALEECAPILDDAFAGADIGPPPGAGSDG